MYTCHPKKIAFKRSRDVTVAKNLAVCRDVFMPSYDILRPEKTSFLPLSTERINKESYKATNLCPAAPQELTAQYLKPVPSGFCA